MSSTVRSEISRIRIIAVDDSPDNLFLIETILDDPEYDLELAKSGQEALEKIASETPDLILLDVMMPGMDGFEVTRRIRKDEALSCTPILLVTAYESVNMSGSLANDVDGLIQKPFNIDELQLRVKALATSGRKHQTRANIQKLHSA